MTQVLEYITQNYTLFLFGAIIILLAVIGYYAEKSNFGQGKADRTKDEKNTKNEIELKNTDLMDVINNDVETNTKNSVQDNTESNIENTIQVESNITSTPDSNQNLLDDKEIGVEKNSLQHSENEEMVNPIIDAIHKELNLVSNNTIFNAEEIKKKETKNQKREEAFNKFSDEFDALLPKKEIIDDDLLSEIDDLELGKTQKFNLKDFKGFDNINLPRISDTVTEEQDIWKF